MRWPTIYGGITNSLTQCDRHVDDLKNGGRTLSLGFHATARPPPLREAPTVAPKHILVVSPILQLGGFTLLVSDWLPNHSQQNAK